MARETSSKPWRKYAAYPGQPEFLPGARLRASTWQDLRKIVSDVEGSPGPPLSKSTQQLETALVEVFNQAVRQVMERNAERLAALMAADRERASTRKDPGGAQ